MKGFQNRTSPRSGIEDFPTPKWATRAFLEHIILPWVERYDSAPKRAAKTVWEPCANRHYMADVLKEYFPVVHTSDVADYGVGDEICDFLTTTQAIPCTDMIITNPPFNKAIDFVEHWLSLPNRPSYLCLLLRTSWLEGKDRYARIFSKIPPFIVAPYVERVAMVQGRLDRKAATAMPYAWFCWTTLVSTSRGTGVKWIPPSRKDFDRDEDWPKGEGND